jgi:hypothetical protein
MSLPPNAPIGRHRNHAHSGTKSAYPSVWLVDQSEPRLEYEVCRARKQKKPTELPNDRRPAIYTVERYSKKACSDERMSLPYP